MKANLTRPLTVALLAGFCCLLWGSAIPFINLGYQHFAIRSNDTPSLILFAGCRFFLAGLLTILPVSLRKKKPVMPHGKGWADMGKLACVQTVAQYVFFYIGVANTVSMNASIIQGLGPFVSILVAAYLFRSEKITSGKWLGGVLGIIGILLVHWRVGGGSLSFTLTGEGFLLFSMIASACSAAMIKRFGQHNDPVALSGWQFMCGGAVMALTGLMSGGTLHPDGPIAALILLYLALLSAVAYSLWAILLRENPVSRITAYIFLQPIFGVALALILFGQQSDVPLWRYAVALVFICAGIMLEERSSEKK